MFNTLVSPLTKKKKMRNNKINVKSVSESRSQSISDSLNVDNNQTEFLKPKKLTRKYFSEVLLNNNKVKDVSFVNKSTLLDNDQINEACNKESNEDLNQQSIEFLNDKNLEHHNLNLTEESMSSRKMYTNRKHLLQSDSSSCERKIKLANCRFINQNKSSLKLFQNATRSVSSSILSINHFKRKKITGSGRRSSVGNFEQHEFSNRKKITSAKNLINQIKLLHHQTGKLKKKDLKSIDIQINLIDSNA